MKKLLTLLLIIPIIGFGQNDTTILTWKNGLTAGTAISWADTSWKSKNDTVKVLLLVCDTAPLPYDNNTSYYSFQIGGDKSIKNRIAFVFWQFGYMVRNYGFYLEYLDEDKKPLRKSIIVWDSKNLHNQ